MVETLQMYRTSDRSDLYHLSGNMLHVFGGNRMRLDVTATNPSKQAHGVVPPLASQATLAMPSVHKATVHLFLCICIGQL